MTGAVFTFALPPDFQTRHVRLIPAKTQIIPDAAPPRDRNRRKKRANLAAMKPKFFGRVSRICRKKELTADFADERRLPVFDALLLRHHAAKLTTRF
jgi:hypothetical protein